MKKIFYVLGIAVLLSACHSQKAVVKNEVKVEKGLSVGEIVTFNDLFIDGVRNKNEGNFDQALNMLAACLEIDSSSTSTMFEMAQIYTAQRQIVKAIELFENAVELNPDNKWYKYYLAETYQINRQFNKASKIYDELISDDPENLEYYYLNVNALGQAGRYKEAVEVINVIEEKEGGSPLMSQEKLRILRLAKMKDEAYSELDELIAAYPDNPQYYLMKAQFCEEDKNDDCAIKNYEKILELKPEMGLVHFSLASFYSQKGDFEKVLHHAQQALTDRNVDLETKIRLYVLLLTNKEKINLSDDHIEEFIVNMVEAHPNDFRSYSIYADFLMNAERTAEAREKILKALEIEANSYPLWEQLVLIDNSLLNFDFVIADSEKALDLFPNQPLLYLLNGIALMQKGEYKDAMQILDAGSIYVIDNKALKIQFDYYLAEVNYNLDNSEEAFAAFERVIAEDPENYMAMNNYAYYLSMKGIKLERAKELSKKAIETNPNNATYLDTYAWILFKMENYVEAKEYMERAIKEDGEENGVLMEHYGDILYKLNRKEEALEYWNKSEKMGNDSETLKIKIKNKTYIIDDEN